MMSWKMLKKILIIFTIVYSIIISFQMFQIGLAKKEIISEIKEREKEISEYNERKKQIETDIKKISEEEKVEKIARDRLNLKKEGETTYKIIDK